MDLVGVIKQEGTVQGASFLIGHIASTAPLVVKIGDISITRQDMKINQYLLKGHRRRYSLATTTATGVTGSRSGGSGDDSFASHNHDMNTVGIPSGEYTTLDDFSVGEAVLMLRSEDQQIFVLVCKLE
jgi:hypothetical protein